MGSWDGEISYRHTGAAEAEASHLYVDEDRGVPGSRRLRGEWGIWSCFESYHLTLMPGQAIPCPCPVHAMRGPSRLFVGAGCLGAAF